ncbi:SusD/RagB family nutrient-binding outer membrane lipoprotein [Pontibacter sp. MBLB2868]|uniref:SusD/RagB family nutrient-binding outer membrane lipoprotein n=1 Tax=Pontibacter sp. MBLB2868 TaxID=3451555 RepID=UPI003F750234
MKKIIRYIGVVLAVLSFSACEKDFLDVNTDPNNPVDAPSELVFPVAAASTASVVGGQYAIIGGIWSQYYTQSHTANQYKTIDVFNVSSTSFEDQWEELYAGALNDYEFVKEKAVQEQNWNSYLMATVMEAYTYQVLADLYDKIPFDEALAGEEGNLSPVFRDGQVVYDSLIVRLDKALAKPITSVATGKTGANDVVFGGKMDQWVRFANTLKLKMYLRQVYARPQVAEAGIKALYNANAPFLTSDASLDFFIDADSKRNPLYEQDQKALSVNNNLRASNTMLSFLTANNDPRLDKIYIPGKGGYKGMEQGNVELSSSALDPETVSRALILPTAPTYFISKSESYFLQAEAVLRGYGTGDVVVLYNQAVDASFAQQGLDRGNLYPFPAGASFEDKLKAIIVQKWVALAGTYQGIEAFLERNRTNYPATSPVATSSDTYVPGQFTYPVNGITGGVFVKRFVWPSKETTRNPNAPKTIEPATKPVWWDIN